MTQSMNSNHPWVLNAAWLAAGLTILWSTAAAAAEPRADAPRIVVCPMVKEGPKIDGRLDDEVWKLAPPQTRMSSQDGKTAAEPKTRFRILTDGKWLYFGVELRHPKDMSKYDLSNRGPNNVDFKHETVEIFIAPDYDDERYYQFALEPGGTDYDNVAGGTAFDFNSGWRHATSMKDDHWVAEVAVPLAGIGFASGLPAGSRIAFNVCRETSDPVKLQAWSPPGFTMREAFGEAVIGSFREAVALQLGELEKQSPPHDMTAVMNTALAELRDVGRQVADGARWRAFLNQTSKLRRQLLQQSLEGKDMQVWEADPWALPTSKAAPPLGFKEVETLQMEAFQGEYLVRALGIANAGEDLLQVRVVPREYLTSVDGLNAVPAKRHLQVHQVLEMQMSGKPRRDALPRLRFHEAIAVPAGGNGVVWLNIHTHNLEPGLWVTEIELLPLLNQHLSRLIPIVIKVLPARLPQGPRPYAIGWCANPYNGGFLDGKAAGAYDRETAVQDLKDYMVSVFLIPAGETGYGTIKYDDKGRMISPPDLSAMEKWIEDFGSNNAFYVLSVFYDYLPKELGGGGQWGDIQKENFGKFIGHVRRFFAERGIGVTNYAWYADDEPGLKKSGDSGWRNAEGVAKFGQLVQATDPAQQIFVTVYGSTPMEALEIMAPYVNVWVASLGLKQEQRDFIRKRPARLFSYRVWTRTGHPYRNYRAMGTEAFELGYEAIGLWAYGAWTTGTGRSLWHDESRESWIKAKYSLNYEGEGELVSSTRKEGWRMAIQDYRYWEWLSGLIKRTGSPELAEAGRALMRRVMSARGTSTQALDQGIHEIRPLLMKLLVSVGDVRAETWRANQALRMPALLTYNGQVTAARRIDTGGYYYYHDYAKTDGRYGETCQVTDGKPIYFRGRDAADGPQAKNRKDGNLTDGLCHTPGSFMLFWAPKTLGVTFDFMNAYRLDYALFHGSECQFAAFVSGSGKKDDWVEVDALPSKWPKARTNHEGAVKVDLQGREARYLRLQFNPPPERPNEPGKLKMKITEVTVFGQPLPKEALPVPRRERMR